MIKINFTQSSISNIPLPDKRIEYQDTTFKFWRLRVSPSGSRSFEVFKRLKGGTNKRVVIGRFDQGMTVKEARVIALELSGMLSKGQDPASVSSEREARKVTLREVYSKYIKEKNLQDKTITGYNSLFRNYFGDFADKSIVSITRKEIEAWYGAIESEAQANGSFRLFNAMFSYASGEYVDSEGKGLIQDNPLKIVTHKGLKHKSKRKQTHIRNNQFTAFRDALESVRTSGTITQMSVCDALLFSLYTGLRKEEVLSLKWMDIKETYLIIPNTKSGRPLELPITSSLQSIINRDRLLSSEYVFPSENSTGKIIEPKKVVAKIRELSGCDCSWHDLRRTFLTLGENLHIGRYTLKRLANHALSSDVTEGYLVLTSETLRESSVKIHNFIDTLLQGK